MLPVHEARARILAPLRPTGTETVGLSQAWGRVLATPIVARLTQPPADVSAMDGYAVRAADAVDGAELAVVGAAPAGHPFQGVVGPGQAVRLFTGSVVPQGADAVLPQEVVERVHERVHIREAARLGRHIRPKGNDFTAGTILLDSGIRLGARAVGLAAAGNHPWLTVHRRPRIAILATGDEVVLPGETVAPGGIVSSNAHAVAALVRAAGGDAVILPIAADDSAAIAAVADDLGGIDLLVTTGGASVGDHDLIRDALASRGFVLDFWQVAMRPGKPLLFGRLGAVPVLGLPGNPVSAFVCAVLFLLPALARLGGLVSDQQQADRARLGVAVGANDRRADHLRATLRLTEDGVTVATPFSGQDSSMLRLLSQADALIVRPPNAPPLPAGAEVPILRLDVLGL